MKRSVWFFSLSASRGALSHRVVGRLELIRVRDIEIGSSVWTKTVAAKRCEFHPRLTWYRRDRQCSRGLKQLITQSFHHQRKQQCVNTKKTTLLQEGASATVTMATLPPAISSDEELSASGEASDDEELDTQFEFQAASVSVAFPGQRSTSSEKTHRPTGFRTMRKHAA